MDRTHIDNHHVVARYLADGLSEDGLRAFKAYIDSHHVVARYLADGLSEDELRAFENYLVTDPSIMKDVEATARLKVGLHKLRKNGELDTLMKPPPWFQKPAIFAMAASIIVVALGVWFWTGRSGQPPALVASLTALADRSGNLPSVLVASPILRTRGDSYDLNLELPSTPQAIELRVLPEVKANPARYRVTIARIGDDDSLTPSGQIAGLTQADDEFVTLYLNSAKFNRGRYLLTIGGDADTDAANAVSTFRIKLTAPPADPRN